MGRRGEVLERLRHPTEAVPHDFRTTIRTIVGVAVLIPALLLASLVVVVLTLLRAPRRLIDRCYVAYADLGVLIGGTRIEAHGLEHVQPGVSYVVVANHESDWDPVVLFATLRMLVMRAVIKDEMMRLPLLGRALAASGNVRVTRGSDAIGDIERLRATMAGRPPDVSILFYAEGTRSRDGSLRPFKKGPFVTAIAAGLPILPVATAGTYRIWPPVTVQLRRGPVVVCVGEPIPTSGCAAGDREALRDRCFAAVRDLRTAARKLLRDQGIDPGGVD
jgi:1-acyl-sn-glycerol-3-phosphate acyltransferase